MVAQTHKRATTINILSFVSACLAIYLEFSEQRTLYMAFKPLTTILIISLLFFTPKSSLGKFRSIILTALGFCLLGDIFLLWENYFVFGLASFLVAHLLFATGFIQLEGFQLNRITLLSFLFIGTGLFLWLRPDLGNFLVPVTIYIMVITFMAWQGINLFLKDRKRAYALIAIAVLLFMFSDTMIAINKFKSPFRLSGPIILSTYWLSIALIANATHKIVLEKQQA